MSIFGPAGDRSLPIEGTVKQRRLQPTVSRFPAKA
jgi:hypothetical protein